MCFCFFIFLLIVAAPPGLNADYTHTQIKTVFLLALALVRIVKITITTSAASHRAELCRHLVLFFIFLIERSNAVGLCAFATVECYCNQKRRTRGVEEKSGQNMCP
jgi:hypothetical protein